jgi:excisionase family DNA binding protein
VRQFQPFHPLAANSRYFAAGLLLEPAVVSLASLGDLMTVREAAVRFRVSTRTIYELCDGGRLAHVRLGHVIRIPENSISSFLVWAHKDRKRELGIKQLYARAISALDDSRLDELRPLLRELREHALQRPTI